MVSICATVFIGPRMGSNMVKVDGIGRLVIKGKPRNDKQSPSTPHAIDHDVWIKLFKPQYIFMIYKRSVLL